MLLEDDLAGGWHTLIAFVKLRKERYEPITDLRSAVIWTKGISTFEADYSVEDLPTNPWIHQPFEHYDSLRPENLKGKWRI